MITQTNRAEIENIITKKFLEIEERWRGKGFLDRLLRPFAYTYVTWDDVGETLDKILKELGVNK